MRTYLLLLFSLFPILLSAQQIILNGIIRDGKTLERLAFTNIIIDDQEGSSSDSEGTYNLELSPGTHSVSFAHLGYQTYIMTAEDYKAGVVYIRDIFLHPVPLLLRDVVVSAGRYEQQIANTTVSMQVLKAEQIENNLSFDLAQSLEKVPGVDVIDGQANIRSGSGWSYGAGSRVLVLVDDLPLLSPDAADAKWNLLPIENISQVEILKGASSALYGSSALNGVINIRTAWPGEEPVTKASLLSGVYFNPARKELIWDSERIPVFGGAQFLHARRFKNLDFVLSANAFNDPGYRQHNYQARIRVNTKIRYRDPKIKGLDYGLSASLMHLNMSDFLLWRDADSGAWIPNPGAISPTRGYRAYIDPFINYYAADGSKHQIRTRFFNTVNNFPTDPDKENKASQLFAEYQFNKRISNTELSGGLSGTYAGSEARLYGDHTYQNLAIFGQADKKFDRLSLSFGGRWEYFSLDKESESRPVFRTGVNYQIAEYTFLRGSFGQGFRFPSIAEKYITTSVGGLNVFPNPALGSEDGWNAEIGVRQAYQFGLIQGYVDVAAFWTEYKNMMEFSFGFYDTLTYLPTNEYFSIYNMGFQSQNIGNARIAGIEISTLGQGKIGPLELYYMLGYTFTDPVDQNTDSLYRAGKSVEDNILKYRYRHSFDADLSIEYKAFSLGMSFVWHSYMECVDQIFVDPILGQFILPGYADYREQHMNEAYTVSDLRIGVMMHKNFRTSLMLKNIFNRENSGRPGDIRPPRTLVVRVDIAL